MRILNEHPIAVTVAALAVLAFAGARLLRPQHPAAIREATSAHYEDVSRQMLKAAAHMEAGAKVVLLAYKAELESSNKGQLESVFRTLKKAGLSIEHVERLAWDDARGWRESSYGFPYEEFLRVARAHPGVQAIISLCGAPYLSAGTERPDPSTLPSLVVTRVDHWSGSLQALVNEGRVASAVVPMEDLPAATNRAAEGYGLLTPAGVR